MKLNIQYLIVGIVFFSSLGGAVFASDTPLEKPSYVLPNTQIVPLRSETNGVDYRLYIKLPKGYEKSEQNYPVMVTLDADYQFAVAANHVEHLADRGQAPDMIIVSIGYNVDPTDKLAYRINRTRDYTPAHTLEGGYGPDIQKYSGGGEDFAKVISDEILPFLEENFHVDTAERIYVGHSYGGMFGAYLLLSHPEIFNRYILVSPSLWFNDKMMLKDEAYPEALLTRKTYVYMGVGDWENQPERSYAMVDDLLEFAAMLEARHDQNLIFKTRVFEDETHASIFPAVLSTGVRHLFQTMDE